MEIDNILTDCFILNLQMNICRRRSYILGNVSLAMYTFWRNVFQAKWVKILCKNAHNTVGIINVLLIFFAGNSTSRIFGIYNP